MFEDIYKRSLRIDDVILQKLQALLVDRPVTISQLSDIGRLSPPELDAEYPHLTIEKLKEDWLEIKKLLELACLDRMNLRREHYELLRYLAEGREDNLNLDQFKVRSQVLPYHVVKTLLERERAKNERSREFMRDNGTQTDEAEENYLVTKRISADCTPHEEFLNSDFFTEIEMSSVDISPTQLTLGACSPVSCQSYAEENLEVTELSHNLPKIVEHVRAKIKSDNPSSPETPLALVGMHVPDTVIGLLNNFCN